MATASWAKTQKTAGVPPSTHPDRGWRTLFTQAERLEIARQTYVALLENEGVVNLPDRDGPAGEGSIDEVAVKCESLAFFEGEAFDSSGQPAKDDLKQYREKLVSNLLTYCDSYIQFRYTLLLLPHPIQVQPFQLTLCLPHHHI